MFSSEFCKIFMKTFCSEHLWTTTSANNDREVTSSELKVTSNEQKGQPQML